MSDTSPNDTSATSPTATGPGTAVGDVAVTAPLTRRAAAARRLRAWWSALVGVIGAVVGLAPHVLHHVGLIAGTALITGVAGTSLFGVVGLAASVPFLLRLRRRFGSWWAPTIGLVVFAVMFSLSAFVVGPAISSGPGASPGGGEPSPSPDHDLHHS